MPRMNNAEASGPSVPASAARAAVSEQARLSQDLLDRLEEYRVLESRLKSQDQAKPDTVANKMLKDKLRPPHEHGHIQGMPPGATLRNRGEVAILGGHTQIFRGIDANLKKHPGGALAIVLSGGYKDDLDDGTTTFWYTGEGGQDPKKRQVTDQTFTRGNEALKCNFETGKPVRVFRGTRENGELMYVYDGLYNVKECKQEPSQDGPLVCKFLLVGVPGESVATMKVNFMNLYAGAGRARRLHFARLAGEVPRHHKRRQVDETPESLAVARQLREEALSKRPHLVVADISGGKEALPLPVFNEINDELPPDDLEYVADYVWGPGVEEMVRPVLEREATKMREFCACAKPDCGIQFSERLHSLDKMVVKNRSEVTPSCPYFEGGFLSFTEPFGVHECGPECFAGPAGGNKKCRGTQQVSRGVRLPLEVFMTAEKGWGVRCATKILQGQFVVAYIGELVTAEIANARLGSDTYLFELDHFERIFEDIGKAGGMENLYPEVPKHKMPPPCHYDTYEDFARAVAGEPSTTLAVLPHVPPAPSAAGVPASSPDNGDSVCDHDHATGKSGEVAGAAGAGLRGGTAAGQGSTSGQEALPKSSGDGAFNDSHHFLSVDAKHRGNVARFINHNCDGGNLVHQTVFAKDARSTVHYYTALFAARDIEVNEELEYNYNWQPLPEGVEFGQQVTMPNRSVRETLACRCGAANCAKAFIMGAATAQPLEP